MNRIFYFQTQYSSTRTSSRAAGKAFMQKAFLFFIMTVAGFQTLRAQCLTFHNADSANPILNASPVPQNISGFRFVDIDGDGDQDCYIASNNRLQLYRNTGTPRRPQYILCSTTGFENDSLPYFGTDGVFAFADLDGDGDFDFLTSDAFSNQGHGGESFYLVAYENKGTPQNPVFVKGGANPAAVASNNPRYGFTDISFQDINGDGKPDLYVSEHTFSEVDEFFYLNTSSTKAPVFTFYGSYFYSYFPNIAPYASFHDFTGDGLPDLVQNDGQSYTQYIPNVGTVDKPAYDFPYYDAHPNFDGVAPYVLADLNGDGAVEAFSRSGHYATLAPVAIIKKTTVKAGSRSFVKLAASHTDPSYSYRWEYNGKMIPGYGKPFIIALKKGEYVLYITDTCGTGISLPYTLPDTLSSGKEASLLMTASVPVQAATAAVYPNPFTQSVRLQLPQGKGIAKSIIRVTDMSGRLMLTQATSAASLSVGSTLPKGVYLLQVWQNGNMIYHTMILKQ